MPRTFVRPDRTALLRIRTEKGLTQDDVAIRSGYAKRTGERIETGGRSTLVTLSDIAAALGVPVNVLVLAAPEVPAHLADWIDSGLDEGTSALLTGLHLADLLSPSDSANAVTLTCRTSRGDFTYDLRRNTTAAELCAALRNDLFPGVDGYEHLALGTAQDRTYDAAHTVAHIAAQSGGLVSLFRYSAPGVLAMASGQPFGPKEALAIAHRGIPAANSLACRFYVWLLDRSFFRLPGISTLAGIALGTVGRFALLDLLYLGWLYAESNTDIQMAARIARVIKLVPVRLLGDDYFDTLSWIAYRSGDLSDGLRWARRISADNGFESDIRAYHLYFLLRGLNVDPGVRDLIRGCFASQTHESVAQARVRANDDKASGSADLTKTYAPKLPFRTRSALIVLLIGVGFILYPRAFFALLWFLGGLLALSVLITLAVLVHGWFAKRFKARRKR